MATRLNPRSSAIVPRVTESESVYVNISVSLIFHDVEVRLPSAPGHRWSQLRKRRPADLANNLAVDELSLEKGDAAVELYAGLAEAYDLLPQFAHADLGEARIEPESRFCASGKGIRSVSSGTGTFTVRMPSFGML